MSYERMIEALAEHAGSRPDAVAYRFLAFETGREREITYGALDRRARAIARELADRTRCGDRAILLYPSSLDYIAALFGCFYAGVVAVPVYPPVTGRMAAVYEHIADDADPSVVLTNSLVIRQIRRVHRIQLLHRNPWFRGISERLFKQWIDVPLPDRKAAQWLNTDSVDDQSAPATSEPLREYEVALLQYTSGSTGAPKGVMVLHRNLLANQEAIQELVEGRLEEDRGVGWLPLYHDMGLIGNVLHTVFRGGNIVLFSPLDFIHKPVRWLQAIATHGATISAGPNFAYELCINKIPDGELEGLDLSRWRVALNGAEPLRKTTIERFSRKFEACGFRREAFRPCYGLAENTLIATGRSAKSPLRFLPQPDPSPSARDAASRELVSCGTPLRTEVAIVDPIERSPCPPGRVGEIWLAGPSVAGGYWRKPTETEQTFRAFLADGSRGPFLRTGDLGLLDRGELFVTGRLKDLIILRGQNLHPEDIEATVEVEHPALRRGCCAAFAIQRDGEERLVVVQEVRKTHVDPEPIFLAIRRALRREHAVRADDIVLVEARTIPKTTSGKLRRSACKEAYLRGDLAVVASMRRSEEGLPTEAIATDARQLEQVLGRVKAMIAEEVELDPSEVVDSDRIMDLGLDSLAAVTLLEWVEREFRVTVPNEFLLENPSLLELARQMVDLQDLSVPEPRAARTTSERLGLFEGGSPMLKEMDKGLPANLVVQAQERRRLWIQGREVIDFASCNYLGLDQRKEIMQAIPAALAHWGVHPSWTRAVASPEIYDELEAELARTLGVGHVIVFPSISLLNVGVLPLLTAGDGALFLDDIAHNTLRQGCDLAEARGATLVLFPHDDLDILERKLAEHGDRHPKLIVVDGVYSMSGQYADLPAYAALARRHDAFLYVDDAHGFGILGEQPDDELPYGYGGSGLVRHHGLDYTQDRIIYLAGLSKAFSTYAAFMACFDEQMKKRIRLANPYIFSGPIPTASLASGLAGLRLSRADGDITRTRIFSLTKRLVDGLHRVGLKTDNTNYFPIVFVPLGPVAETLRIWKELWKEGFLITPGVFPATPVDRGGVRVSVTAANTEEEIDSLIECLRRLC